MQILLPLKEFAAAKQRLAGVLSAVERAQLFEAMVEDVLEVLTQHSAITRIAICSRDQAARWLASYYSVEFIDESALPAFDLNAAVNAAARDFYARGGNDLAVVHGDLPALSAADITAFLQAHGNTKQTRNTKQAHRNTRQAHRNTKSAAVTIARDRRGAGTNLLAWRNLPNYVASYGENSFQRHCMQARELNIEPTICDLPSARCDIDEPDDLSMLLSWPADGSATKTLAFLHRSGVAARLSAMRDEIDPSPVGENRERA